MRADLKRNREGKMEQNRRKNRETKRKRCKLKSRLVQVGRDMYFTKEEKRSMRKAFAVESMSPEVTDDEDESRKVSIPFQWESSRMTEIKREIDQDYRKALTAQSRRQKASVNRSSTQVMRTSPPKEIPS
ncbi:uncharacterized protein LOC133180059 [Saccostrea echinata]|uniref:uncharacterized protein LOC133180059 n=1 Tax=Saccostrea echinata TaxID=191078 RepID=UPI002A813835|nr:uncharacterized protein LOC133180059 [Saccostrea echinata]